MAEPFLILHRVRNEPAFDIAIRLDEEIWIIPTSGHRAYPYWQMPLPITEYNGRILFAMGQTLYDTIDPMPDHWPDHYATNATKPSIDAPSLLERLGLLRKEPIRRRI